MFRPLVLLCMSFDQVCYNLRFSSLKCTACKQVRATPNAGDNCIMCIVVKFVPTPTVADYAGSERDL